MNKDKAAEYLIDIDDSTLEIHPVKPVIKYEVDNQPFFSFNSVPY